MVTAPNSFDALEDYSDLQFYLKRLGNLFEEFLDFDDGIDAKFCY